MERHAWVKYRSFESEIDSRVFRCLGEIDGCRRLMNEIVNQKTFLPEATWLISYYPKDGSGTVDCGTIQGLAHSKVLGAVQNIGVIPEFRGMGLGRALLLQSLFGYRDAKLQRVFLEVTAQNETAVSLYNSLGFALTRTLYKAVEVEEAPAY